MLGFYVSNMKNFQNNKSLPLELLFIAKIIIILKILIQFLKDKNY